MQAIFESVFDLAYLGTVLFLGIRMLRLAKTAQYRLYGFMAVILALGDAFHLIPRASALLTDGLNAHVAALGVGKLITSITMTLFYLLLYGVWRQRYQVKGRTALTAVLAALAAVRIGLCCFPQNQWTQPDAPLLWGVYRNIPFVLMGVILIVLFVRSAKARRDAAFRFMGLAIALSFLFYIPVVLFSDRLPLIGMLMIPKTLCYVWIVWMGYADLRRSLR